MNTEEELETVRGGILGNVERGVGRIGDGRGSGAGVFSKV